MRSILKKRGQAHLEMIISFVIFVGFIFFIFYFFNPLKKTSDSGFVNSVFVNLEKEFSVHEKSISVMINDSNADLIGNIENKGCFKFDVGDLIEDLSCQSGSGRNILVSVRDGTNVESKFQGDDNNLKIQFVAQNYFYTVHCAEDLTLKDLNNGNCENLNKESDYSIGIVTEKDYWNNKSVTEFFSQSYENARGKIVPQGSDFAVSVRKVADDGEIFKMNTDKIPRTIEVFAKTISVEILHQDASAERVKVIISVW